MLITLLFVAYFIYTLKYIFYDSFVPNLTSLCQDITRLSNTNVNDSEHHVYFSTNDVKKMVQKTRYIKLPFSFLKQKILLFITSYLRVSFQNNMRSFRSNTHSNTHSNIRSNIGQNHCDIENDSSDDDIFVNQVYHADDTKIRILEIGPGLDSFNFTLSPLFGDMHFDSIDLVHENIMMLNKKKMFMDNISFMSGDITNPPEELWKHKYNVIYGMNTLKYLDNEEKRSRFLLYASSMLADKGKLICVDHFRPSSSSSSLSSLSSLSSFTAPVQHAYQQFEYGQCINMSPTKENWIAETKKHGLMFETQLNLTQDAKVLHITLLKRMRFIFNLIYTLLPTKLLQKARMRWPIESAYLISIFLEGYTYAHDAGEYGILVFQKIYKKEGKKDKKTIKWIKTIKTIKNNKKSLFFLYLFFVFVQVFVKV